MSQTIKYKKAKSDSFLTLKWIHYVFWTLQVLAALAFLAAGGSKLLGVDRMVSLFASIDSMIGTGQWFRVLTGLIEVGGAVLLLIPGAAWIGATVLAVVMIGAILTHAFLIGGSFVPALVLLVITSAIAWFHRPREYTTIAVESGT
ncbi:DoxX family protein [Pseudahrensia aquimaris]|uniref:DoxX family protein n=1 Tax=Pseudahrensia aquimaris TaxID=744461 RepID=A0ABW3FGJ1_9HYPH